MEVKDEEKTVTHPAVTDMIDGRLIPLTPFQRDEVERQIAEDRLYQATKRGDSV